MEFISEIINSIIQSFDFGYCLTVNILVYLIVKLFDNTREKRLSKWQKRIVLVLSAIFLGVVYYFIGADMKIIANSVILAPVSWSWVFKPICGVFNIDYKKFNVLD